MCGGTTCLSQDVREYAAERGFDEQEALHVGMAEKAEEFRRLGGRLYVGR